MKETHFCVVGYVHVWLLGGRVDEHEPSVIMETLVCQVGGRGLYWTQRLYRVHVYLFVRRQKL